MKKISYITIIGVFLLLVACSDSAKNSIATPSASDSKSVQSENWVTATNGNMSYKIPESWNPEVNNYYVYYYPLGKSPLQVMFYMYYDYLDEAKYSSTIASEEELKIILSTAIDTILKGTEAVDSKITNDTFNGRPAAWVDYLGKANDKSFNIHFYIAFLSDKELASILYCIAEGAEDNYQSYYKEIVASLSSKTTLDNNVKTNNDILSNASISQQNAYKAAISYLNHGNFSRKGLIEQLEFEKYSNEDATWAVDNCGADWNEQAILQGKNYLSHSSFSHDGLIEQLEFEGFTTEQAIYAADTIFGNQNDTQTKDSTDVTTTTSESANSSGNTLGEKNALAKAKDYLAFSAFSYSGLKEQLEYEGFTSDEAKYAVDNCEADWNEQAAKKAKDYMAFTSFSRNGLIEQLEYEGFTSEQAIYGVEKNGY